MSPRLRRAFLQTCYEAGSATARIAHRSHAIDAILAAWNVREGAFVSAANPCARRKPDGWNRRMDAALRQRLRRAPCLPGQGRGRGWAEPHLLTGCPIPSALRLARVFRQAAIVVVRRNQPAKLCRARACPAPHP